jgi:hypothetical protein
MGPSITRKNAAEHAEDRPPVPWPTTPGYASLASIEDITAGVEAFGRLDVVVNVTRAALVRLYPGRPLAAPAGPMPRREPCARGDGVRRPVRR